MGFTSLDSPACWYKITIKRPLFAFWFSLKSAIASKPQLIFKLDKLVAPEEAIASSTPLIVSLLVACKRAGAFMRSSLLIRNSIIKIKLLTRIDNQRKA